MLNVKGITKGRINDNEICEEHYVLEYSTDAYIRDYGDEHYTYLQDVINTASKLDVICKYVFSDEIDAVSSGYYTVYTQKQFFLIDVDSDEVTKLDYKSISDVHNHVFNLMREYGDTWQW